jgi:cytosine/uracil/thiamine/allantoin permease
MEMNGQGKKADRIDRVMDWVYPLAYIVLFGMVIWAFFVAESPPFL